MENGTRKGRDGAKREHIKGEKPDGKVLLNAVQLQMNLEYYYLLRAWFPGCTS